MIKNILVRILCFMSLGLPACNFKTDKLKEIDGYIELYPDSAMCVLSNLNRTDLTHSELAYFALLYTQAQIKCGVILTSDTLFRFAYDNYSVIDSGDKKMRTHFYKAKIAYNRGELQKSMREVLIAYELSKKENNVYWRAKSAELIADIFYDAYNFDQSLIYEQEAIDNYLKAGKIANHRYALCDLASIYLNQDRDKDAIELLDSLKTEIIAETPIDTVLVEYLDLTTISALQKTNRLNEIEQITPTYLRSESVQDEINLSYIESFVLSENGDLVNVSEILSDALGIAENERQEIKIKYAYYHHYLLNADYKNASLMADSLLVLQNQIVERILNESLSCVQRDFYLTVAKDQERKTKNLTNGLLLVIIVAIISTIIILIINRLKLRTKKAELESKASLILYLSEQSERVVAENTKLTNWLDESNNTVELLKRELEDHSSDKAFSSTVVENLFKERWSTLNMLCNEYFELNGSEKTRRAILNNIDKELKKMTTAKKIKEIEIAVDAYMGNIMTMLRFECNFLNETDFTFLSLIYAGLSVRTICLFLNMKYKLFYLKKSRLSKRILNSDAAHKELFVEKMK